MDNKKNLLFSLIHWLSYSSVFMRFCNIFLGKPKATREQDSQQAFLIPNILFLFLPLVFRRHNLRNSLRLLFAIPWHEHLGHGLNFRSKLQFFKSLHGTNSENRKCISLKLIVSVLYLTKYKLSKEFETFSNQKTICQILPWKANETILRLNKEKKKKKQSEENKKAVPVNTKVVQQKIS